MQFLASFDGLTALLNRNSVQKRLSELHNEGLYAAALLVDLDGFKQVNDSYGHHTGDLLLKQVAERMQKNCDGQKLGGSARWG